LTFEAVTRRRPGDDDYDKPKAQVKKKPVQLTG